MPGTLAHSPAEIVRQLLVDLSLGTNRADNSDWPVFDSSEPDSPDNCITVYDTVGTSQGRIMFDGFQEGYDGVQIRIRSTTHDVGWAKADAIKLALDALYQRMVAVSTSRYEIHSINRVSAPSVEVRGKDTPSTKRSLFFINCLLHVETN